MSRAAAPRFDQDRKDWAASADPLADSCYREYWGISNADIYDLEALVNSVHDTDAGYKTHQILDYGGVDRIVDAGGRHVYLAQRFRPNERRQVDFSIRADCGVEGRSAEIDKWQAAHELRGFFPSVIGFGVFDSVISAFAEFHLISTRTVLDALAAETLEYDHNVNDDDGTAAVYITTDELSDHGAILRTWDGVAPEQAEPEGDG